MADTRFDAQTVTETATRAASQTFEIVLENARAERLRLSLPLHLARNVLVPILATMQGGTPSAGMPEFSKTVDKWKVGHATDEPKVLLQLCDDPPYAMHVADAKKLWRQVREEAETVGRRAPRTRQ